jgi:hypothetical protein
MSVGMYHEVCKIVLLYCFNLVLHFKFVPHTIINRLLKFHCTHLNVILLLAQIKKITLQFESLAYVVSICIYIAL